MLSLLVGLVWAAPGGLQVSLSPGVDPRRGQSTKDLVVVTRTLVRPPDGSEWTLGSSVPRTWVGQASPGRREEELSVVAAAVRAAGWDKGADPLTLARRVALLTRSDADPPPARDDHLFDPWEVLVDHAHADSLDAALVAVELLAELGVKAQVAGYEAGPAWAFGAWVAGAGSGEELRAVDGGVFIAGHKALLPVAGQAVRRWSAAEVRAPGWAPGAAATGPEPGPGPAPGVEPGTPPAPPAVPTSPAVALPAGDPAALQWYVFSAALVGGLGLFGAWAWWGARERERRVRARRREPGL